MISIDSNVVVRFALEPVDFRKSIDGLANAVGESLGRDPMCGELFIFRNKRRNALKMLYWTPNGFVLLYKRLERKCFTPARFEQNETDILLDPVRLGQLLAGITRSIKT